MNGHRSPLRRITALAVFLGVALAMAGCAKKITSVDPSYTSPEGRPAAGAQQIVHPDLPVLVLSYLDKAPPGISDEDSLLATERVYAAGQGVIHGMIFDGTAASGYQILRRERNGGYAPLYDYALYPVRRYVYSGWKLFTWQDGRPSGFSPPTYLGRGVVADVITPQSPLTNVAIVSADSVVNIRVESDSLRSFAWSYVPGAIGYFLQVYSFKGGKEEEVLSGAPAPVVGKGQRDHLLAWIPRDQRDVRILTVAPVVPTSIYLVRVSAVDSLGRLVGFSYGEYGYAPGPEVGEYRLYLRGAVTVAAATLPKDLSRAPATFSVVP